MNTQHEPAFKTLATPTLAEMLRQIEADALRLKGLAHQAGLLVMAASLGITTSTARFVDMRRVGNDLSQIVSTLRGCERRVVPRMGASVRGQIAAALSSQSMDTYDQLILMVRDLLAALQSEAVSVELGRAELFRYISTDIENAVTELLAAAKAGLAELSAEDNMMAYVDDLTGLPNRRALYQMADRLWNSSGPGQSLTLMRLDIDNIKVINDTFGHAAGDFILRRAARILRQQLRTGDFAARVSGDEFMFVMCGEVVANTAATHAQQIIDKVAEPTSFEGQMMCSTISIGVVCVKAGESHSLDRLLHNADLALFAARSDGGAQYQFFTPEMRTRQEASEAIVSQIARGIERGEFVPYFQPQIEGRTGALVGFEALARWHHPERGVLTPYHFLDIAQQKGLLDALDWQIITAAIEALKQWRAAGLHVPQVSINISPDRLSRAATPQELADLMTAAELPRGSIGVEILESAMIDSGNFEMIRTVQQLSKAGFVVELDDFGTGHASIANLRHFKVDRIKIDRSFIKDIHLHPDLSKITSAIIGLAHSLRIDALAEGVETPEERLILNALGVDHIQGFGVARPMPQSQVAAWIKHTQRRPALPPRLSPSG